jgi:hypothetical protein
MISQIILALENHSYVGGINGLIPNYTTTISGMTVEDFRQSDLKQQISSL